MSDESACTTLSEGMARSLVLLEPLDYGMAVQILQRTSSVGAVDSTASSFAVRMNKARFLPSDKQLLRDIGRGSCGSVFEVHESNLTIKKGANTTAI
jgi:hypothetical protein